MVFFRMKTVRKGIGKWQRYQNIQEAFTDIDEHV